MTPGAPPELVIGLGGNVGSEAELRARFGHARAALAALADTGEVRSAALYRTAPIGPSQPPYLNTAVALRAAHLQPAELAHTLLELERLLGRDRTREVRWGPRPIDLDVLLWGARVLRGGGEHGGLEVPHPRLAERRFALAPVVDLLGEDGQVPGRGRAGELLAGVRDQAIEQLAERW